MPARKNIKACQKIAKELGWVFWYDRNIRLWTAIKEGYETLYFPPSDFSWVDFSQKFREYLSE